LKELEESGVKYSSWFPGEDASSLCITVESFVDHRKEGEDLQGNYWSGEHEKKKPAGPTSCRLINSN